LTLTHVPKVRASLSSIVDGPTDVALIMVFYISQEASVSGWIASYLEKSLIGLKAELCGDTNMYLAASSCR